jgi:cytochrome P450
MSKDFKYSVQDLIDEFKTFFFAGTETTSNTSAALIFKLAQHKEYLNRIRAEMNEVFKEDNEISF